MLDSCELQYSLFVKIRIFCHVSGWKINLHLGLTLRFCPIWRIIRTSEPLNWTLSERNTDRVISRSARLHRHGPRAKHSSVNQMECELQTGSSPTAIIICCFLNRTTRPKAWGSGGSILKHPQLFVFLIPAVQACSKHKTGCSKSLQSTDKL